MQENPLQILREDGGYTCIFRTLGCIGDSLSSGEFEATSEEGVKSYHDYYEYSWGQFIARRCGLKAYNFSRGGLTARYFHDFAGYGAFFAPERVCQGYVVALGVNDVTQLVRKSEVYDGFGSMDDVDFSNCHANKNTFVGQYIRILQRIRMAQPKARIFLVTIPRQKNEEEEVAKMRERHAEFVRSLPNTFDFTYVIDLRKYLSTFLEEGCEKYFLGGHMSPMGYAYMATVISTYMDWVIQKYPDDFKQIPFLGKGVHNCLEKW